MSGKRIIIYESSSKGGNYRYSLELYIAYKKSDFKEVTLLLPRNTNGVVKDDGIRDILCSDAESKSKWVGKISFLFRTLINPFILFFYSASEPASLILFNDFEQLSAPLWSFFFRVFLQKHRYAVFLHDPDRDAYPPNQAYSRFSMEAMMKLMNFGLYHEVLPDKSYYKKSATKYLSVPHGIYELPSPDTQLCDELIRFKGQDYLLCIVGNIRSEKNYDLAVKALAQITNVKLVIAGNPSNSKTDVDQYKALARVHHVADNIFWLIKYLSDEEMAAVIEATDCVLLNYAGSFKSQSGILNQIAFHKKKLIVSNTDSSLTKVVQMYNLGKIIKADSEKDLVEGIKSIISLQEFSGENWNEFIEYASWNSQVRLVSELYGSK
jgi:glycosyltransferase involved in cell wall biosynthesis